MTELPRLSSKSLQVLRLIAGGQSYSRIVDCNPEFNYLDVFSAAEEAIWLDERIGSIMQPGDPTIRATEISAMERAKQTYPNAYAPWSAGDEVELATMHADGISESEIAEHFQRQPSAIRARLLKLGLE